MRIFDFVPIRSIMTLKEINISYKEYGGIGELPEEDKELALAAVKATESSYSPYSGFRVGAALRLSTGEIIRGSNQENIAYPSGLCAERTALFYAHAQHPQTPIRKIAIAACQNEKVTHLPVPPCGACRQVMAEYAGKNEATMQVILYGTESIYIIDDARELLPLTFEL